MPQLNPGPWFSIFVVSWMIFIFISVMKISKHFFLDAPLSKSSKNNNTPWTWPWL